MKTAWQLQQPLDAVIFDCDGTLSKLEGIDELAVQNNVGDSVKALTSEAMNTSGMTPSLYEKRLELVKPTRQQVENMGQLYFDQHTPDVKKVIDVLQRLGKTVFVMSAGLKQSVDLFAEHLHIPASQVYAVAIEFDEHGEYKNFDRQSPLTMTGGKGYLVQELKQRYPSVMHIGDGANDVDVIGHVTRFVGYGGVFYRESILKLSDFYIRSLSMSPVLVLALTEDESNQLVGDDRALYEKGMELIQEVVL